MKHCRWQWPPRTPNSIQIQLVAKEDLGRLSYSLALQTTKVLLNLVSSVSEEFGVCQFPAVAGVRVKIPRLSGTTFSIPEAIYSLHSLGDLKRYSKPAALLKHKADKDSGWYQGPIPFLHDSWLPSFATFFVPAVAVQDVAKEMQEASGGN